MTATIRCPRCGITVDADKVDLPNRCHARCPLNKREASTLVSFTVFLLPWAAVWLLVGL